MVAKGCGRPGRLHGFAQLAPILRRVRRLAFLVLLLLGALGLASCGGGGGDRASVENLLDRAFSTPIHSADLKLNAQIELKGLLADPIELQAEGPFRTNKGKLPSADIELRIGSGGGQTISSGVLTTGDRVFVKFQDVYYEQPPAQVRKTNESIARQGKHSGQSLSALGLDPRSWIADAKDEGDADAAGVDTRHVSGTLDVEQLMRNINKFVGKSASALGGGRKSSPRLSGADIRELAKAVKNPSFDVYVSKSDNTIRRVSGRIEFNVPEADRVGLGGLTSGSIVFWVELRNVNGNQKIEAPASSRPLSKLTDSLGGALGALGAGSATPDGSSSGSGSGSSDSFKRYSQCLDKAKPQDTEQLQRCADLLQTP
jgi:hypothetical protein